MAEQTFTAGQVLTATQMSTLQTDIGLNFIQSTTVSNVGAVYFTNCFTSTYANYRVVISNYVGRGGITAAYLRLSNTGTPFTSGYYYNYVRLYSGGQPNMIASNDSGWVIGYPSASGYSGWTWDIMAPKDTRMTTMTGGGSCYQSDIAGFISTMGGATQGNNSSFDGIGISCAVNFDCTISVYGYR
jgi:hypothetical protein